MNPSPSAGLSAYERYLRLDQLLCLQREDVGLVDHDEMIFIIVQQSSELWLKLMAHELTAALSTAQSGEWLTTGRQLRRVNSYLANLTSQLERLDHIQPWSYQVIRTRLENGSGFSSPGWNRVRKLAEPLGAAFFRYLDEQAITLRMIYQQPFCFESFYQLAETLVDLDTGCMLWRLRHLKVIERIIGVNAVGLGGTTQDVLSGLAGQRYYPQLWEIRCQLTQAADDLWPKPSSGDKY